MIDVTYMYIISACPVYLSLAAKFCTWGLTSCSTALILTHLPLCSISGSVQQLRFGAAEQPASPSEQQPQDADQGGAAAAADAAPQGAAAPQPLSPAEPADADQAEQPDAPAAEAAAAYSSDDDGGGYDGGDWGGDSDAEAAPAETGPGGRLLVLPVVLL